MRDARRVVLVVCDSLRRDLVDERCAPTLARLAREGASFARFRGVFPSTTRTSAASIATGCYPAAHGLLGNTMVLDEGEGLVCLSAGKPDFLQRLRRATGRALGRPTLHERIAPMGRALVMSNVSPGAAYVQDPEFAGWVYHRSGSFGPGGKRLDDGLAIEVGSEGDALMTDRFCDALESRAPSYAVLWLSEPDHTGHHSALGSPEHRRAIAAADACVARAWEAVRRSVEQGERVLFAVCSDHGMQTIRRRIDIDARLVEAGLKEDRASRDVVVAPQGTAAIVHFAPHAVPRVAAVADWLRGQDFVARVLAGPELAAAGLADHGSLRLAVVLAGDDEANAFGVRGRSDVAENPLGGESLPGHGQHGGLGEYEQAPFLALWGGGFGGGARDEPVSLVDLAPTFARHLGLDASGMDGRAIAHAVTRNPSKHKETQ
jgi:arylsulfatase A-like enzyme